MPWNKDGSRKSSAFYKMKGSPMQRNFGISPAKHIITDPRKTKGHDRHNKRHVDDPEYAHGKSTEKFD